MPKRSRTTDPNESAFAVTQSIISRLDPESVQPEPVPAKKPRPKRKNPAAVALGRKGGLKGGKARAATMTPEQRAESARKAATARWQRETEQPEGKREK
jgi:hypothetical protein